MNVSEIAYSIGGLFDVGPWFIIVLLIDSLLSAVCSFILFNAACQYYSENWEVRADIFPKNVFAFASDSRQ